MIKLNEKKPRKAMKRKSEIIRTERTGKKTKERMNNQEKKGQTVKKVQASRDKNIKR